MSYCGDVHYASHAEYRRILYSALCAIYVMAMAVAGYSSSHSDTLSLASDTSIDKSDEYEQERVITLEDIEEEPLDTVSSSDRRQPRHRNIKRVEERRVRIHIMADLTIGYFMGNRDTMYNGDSISQIYDSSQLAFSSDHHHVLISAHTPSNVFATFEVVSRAFWEVGYKTGLFSAKFGKLPIPWGHMHYHHIFGGLVEKPAYKGAGTSMLVPGDWAEYGIGIDGILMDTYPFLLKTNVTVTNGLRIYPNAFIADTTIDFGRAVSQHLDNNLDKAIGLRVSSRFYSAYSLSGSFYTSKIAEDNIVKDATLFHGDRVYAGEIDAAASYNSMPWAAARNLEVKAGVALLRAQSESNVPLHYQGAGFLEANYRVLPDMVRIQGRFGLYDDNTAYVTSRDLHNYTVAVYYSPFDNIEITARYIWSTEREQKRENNLFRVRFFARI